MILAHSIVLCLLEIVGVDAGLDIVEGGSAFAGLCLFETLNGYSGDTGSFDFVLDPLLDLCDSFYFGSAWFLVSSTSSFLTELPKKGNPPAPMAQAEGTRNEMLIIKTATRKIFQNVMMAVGLVVDGSSYFSNEVGWVEIRKSATGRIYVAFIVSIGIDKHK